MMTELEGLVDLRGLLQSARLTGATSGSEGGVITLQFDGSVSARHFIDSFYEFCAETRAMRHAFLEKDYRGLSKHIRAVFVLTEILESAFYRLQCGNECVWVFTSGQDANDFHTIWPDAVK